MMESMKPPDRNPQFFGAWRSGGEGKHVEHVNLVAKRIPSVRDGSNSQVRLLLPRPKAIRGAAAPLGRKEAVPSRTEGIPSWAEGNPSQSEGNPSRAEGIPSPAEGIPNVCPSLKSRSFNRLP